MSRRQQSVDKAQVMEMFRKDVERLGSVHAVAREIGTNHSYLYEVFKGHRPPGPLLLKRYGLRREVVYVPLEEAAS